MYKKILIGAATAVAIVGVGGTALAVTGSNTTSGTPAPSPSGSSSTAKGHDQGKSDKGRARILGRHLDHAQIVTSGKKGTVTHDLIRGSVTAVSATSISVKAGDGTTETFAVTKDTVVHVRTAPASGSSKGSVAKGTISNVAKGSSVFVAGTGTSKLTATQVVKLAK